MPGKRHNKARLCLILVLVLLGILALCSCIKAPESPVGTWTFDSYETTGDLSEEESAYIEEADEYFSKNSFAYKFEEDGTLSAYTKEAGWFDYGGWTRIKDHFETDAGQRIDVSGDRMYMTESASPNSKMVLLRGDGDGH